jgi:hypothetical protein
MYGHVKTLREQIDRHFEEVYNSEICNFTGYVLIPLLLPFYYS